MRPTPLPPQASRKSSVGQNVFLLASLAVLVAPQLPLSAQTLTWDSNLSIPGVQVGNGDFDAGNFWWDGSSNVPWVSGADATFGIAPGTGAFSVDVGGMTVDDIALFGFTLFSTAGSLNFNNDSIHQIASGNGAGAGVISANLTGPGDVKITSGTVTFSGNNSYTGSTIVSPSFGLPITLSISHFGALGNGGLILGGNTTEGTLNYTGSTATDARAIQLDAGGGVVKLGAPGTVLTLGGTISGPGSLYLDASLAGGHFELTNAGNSYTGATTIQNGTLSVASVADGGSNSPMGAGTTVVFAPRGRLLYTGVSTAWNRALSFTPSGGTLDIQEPSTVLTLSGQISAGSITKAGPGEVVLANNQPIPGFVVVTDGTLTATGDTSLSGVVLDGGTLVLADQSCITNTFSILQGALTITRPNTLRGTGGVAVNGGTLTVAGSNAIGDLLPVGMSGSGTLKLLADETILRLHGDGLVDLGASTLTVRVDGISSFTGTFAGSGHLIKSVGGLYDLTNQASSFTGGVTIADGSIRVPTLALSGSNSPLGRSGSITLGDATHTGRLSLTSTTLVETDRPFHIAAGGGAVEVSSSSSQVTLSGPIAGSGSLQKLGPGTLRLLGDKSYSGPTIVAECTLRLEGSLAGSVSVSPLGALETIGTRTIGNFTLAGGLLSPGGGATAARLDTLHASFDAGILAMDLMDATPTGYDTIQVTGSVELNGVVQLDLNLGFDPQDHVDVFTLVANDGADPVTLGYPNLTIRTQFDFVGDGQDFWVVSNGFSQLFRLDFGTDSGANDIVISAVPEPGSALLLFGGLATLAPRRRRTRG